MSDMMGSEYGSKAKDAAPPLQMFVFDERRGQVEGEEADKILAFYPTTTPMDDRTRAVGLVQGTIAFMRTFSEDVPCEALQSEKHRWVVHQCEPHIWMVLVVVRPWQVGSARDEGLRGVLRETHQMVQLLHGPLQRLLDLDPSALAVREALSGVVCEVCERLGRSRPADAWASLHNPLSAREGIPLLHLPRPLFTGVQSLLSSLLVASPGGGGRAVAGAVLLQEGCCLWSTLGRRDTAALARFAAACLAPAVRGAVPPSIGKRLASALPSSSSPFRLRGEGGGQWSLLPGKAWCLLGSNHLLLRRTDAPAGPEPELAALPQDEAVDVPLVWLQAGEERCRLVALREGEALLLMLLPERTPPTPALLQQLAAGVAGPLRGLQAAVAEELSRLNRWHIPSYRYLWLDDMLGSSRASPPTKVATLSKDSLALVAALRAEVDAEPGAAELAKAGGRAEVVVRGAQDCWVVGRACGPRQLWLALEGHGDTSMLEVDATTDHFIDTHFRGLLL